MIKKVKDEFYTFDGVMKDAKNDIDHEWNSIAANSLWYAIRELANIIRSKEEVKDGKKKQTDEPSIWVERSKAFYKIVEDQLKERTRKVEEEWELRQKEKEEMAQRLVKDHRMNIDSARKLIAMPTSEEQTQKLTYLDTGRLLKHSSEVHPRPKPGCSICQRIWRLIQGANVEEDVSRETKEVS